MKGSTRVVVTNALHFLPECDKIYVIDNQTTAECGTYQQLISSKSNFSSILRDYSNVKEEKSEENQLAPEEQLDELADVYDDEEDDCLIRRPLLKVSKWVFFLFNSTIFESCPTFKISF